MTAVTSPTEPVDLAVIDASALVALLTDAGPAGTWVAETVSGSSLAAPELMPYEASNILRRQATAELLDSSAATLAHKDLIALPVDLYPYLVVAERTWRLRHNLTIYDAAYVAIAEELAAPVVTLDARLARAPGPRCEIKAYQVA